MLQRFRPSARHLLALAVALTLGFLSWRAWGWAGSLLVGSGMLMWALLHVTRILHVLQRAAQNPVGHVASAVMLNAKLKLGLPLLHVLALTRALGQTLSQPQAQPEIFRWTDAGQSHVTCEFVDGRLSRWRLERPQTEPVSAQS